MNEQYFDDSSAALGLGYSHRARGIAALEMREQQERKALERELIAQRITDIRQVVPRNAGACDALGAFLGRRCAELLAEGYHRGDVTRIALAEWDETADREAASRAPAEEGPDPKGSWAVGAIEDLMRASITPDKRGSRSRSKRRGAKKAGGFDRSDPVVVASPCDRIAS